MGESPEKPLTGVLVARPQVVGGGDDDEPHEAGEEVEERVAAVVVLELLPRHGRAEPSRRGPAYRAGSRGPRPRPRIPREQLRETCHCAATIAIVTPLGPRPDWLGR